MITKTVVKKIARGDHLTDIELDLAVDFYHDLSKKLEVLGPEYHFAWKDARVTYYKLLDFQKYRRWHDKAPAENHNQRDT